MIRAIFRILGRVWQEVRQVGWNRLLVNAMGGVRHLVQYSIDLVERHHVNALRAARMYLYICAALFTLALSTGFSGLTTACLLSYWGYDQASDISFAVFGVATALITFLLVWLLRVLPSSLAAFNYVAVRAGESVREIADFVGSLVEDEDEAHPDTPRQRAARDAHRLAIRFSEPAMLAALSVVLMYLGFSVSGMGGSIVLIATQLMLALVVGMLAFLTGGRIPTWVYRAGQVVAISAIAVIFLVRAIAYHHPGPILPQKVAAAPVARADRIALGNPNVYPLSGIEVTITKGFESQVKHLDLKSGEVRWLPIPAGARVRVDAQNPEAPGYSWSADIRPAKASCTDRHSGAERGLTVIHGVATYYLFDYRKERLIKSRPPVGPATAAQASHPPNRPAARRQGRAKASARTASAARAKPPGVGNFLGPSNPRVRTNLLSRRSVKSSPDYQV